MSRKVILVGGMPTAGKSTIAKALATHFDIPWISTDQIRLIMKAVAPQSDYPMLFDTHGFTADEYFSTFTNEQIAQNEFQQAHEVWACITAFIDGDSDWDKGFVIEGVNIIPSLVKQTYANRNDVKGLFISDSDHERIKKVIFERGLYSHANQYSDLVKQREIQWVQIFDDMIREDAKSTGYDIIDVAKDEADIEKITTLLSWNTSTNPSPKQQIESLHSLP